MGTRFRNVDPSLPSLNNGDGSRGIMYQCRMQYLKSREGGSSLKSKSRRKGSADVLGLAQEKTQFSCLDERMHGPCSSEILLPPNELMTRTKAFRFAYWKYHLEPTKRSAKKLEFGQDERNERLSKKRKEILSRVEAKMRAKKESELRRRAERVMNHSLESMEDDLAAEESDSESIIDMGGYFPTLPSQDDEGTMSPLSPTSNRRKGGRSSMICQPRIKRPEDSFGKTTLPPIGNRRSTMHKRSDDLRGKENAEDSAFSFLSEWGKTETTKQKIRW